MITAEAFVQAVRNAYWTGRSEQNLTYDQAKHFLEAELIPKSVDRATKEPEPDVR